MKAVSNTTPLCYLIWSRTHEPKAPMAPGVRDDVRRGMKEIALREDENLGQLAELLLE
jgi:hypothetical protein